MDETAAHRMARSLIAIHGTGALAVAERAAANVRQLGMKEAERMWGAVAAAIRSIEDGSCHRSLKFGLCDLTHRKCRGGFAANFQYRAFQSTQPRPSIPWRLPVVKL